MSHSRFEAILEMMRELSDSDALTSEFINKYRAHLFGTPPSPTITEIYDFLFPAALSPLPSTVVGAPPTPTSPDTKRRRLSNSSNSELIWGQNYKEP